MIQSALANISIWQLALIAVAATATSILGGVTGYGSGALMPLILVPMVGAEPVVPIIAISAIITNVSRALAFRHTIDWRRVGIITAAAIPTCIIGAWGYTLLTGRGALLVIGSMLILMVGLRRALAHRGFKCGDRGLVAGALGWGIVVGGTTGSGVILLSLLMAAGLTGAAVIATDATVSVADRRGAARGVRDDGRRDLPGGRDRARHRHLDLSRRVPRALDDRAAADARPRRDARRRGCARRRGDDRQCAAAVLSRGRVGAQPRRRARYL